MSQMLTTGRNTSGDSTTADWTPTSAGNIVQRLIQEHRKWRSKDFPTIAQLFEEANRPECEEPCLGLLRAAFHRLRAEMEGHMRREESVLFPAILDAQGGEHSKGFG